MTTPHFTTLPTIRRNDSTTSPIVFDFVVEQHPNDGETKHAYNHNNNNNYKPLSTPRNPSLPCKTINPSLRYVQHKEQVQLKWQALKEIEKFQEPHSESAIIYWDTVYQHITALLCDVKRKLNAHARQQALPTPESSQDETPVDVTRSTCNKVSGKTRRQPTSIAELCAKYLPNSITPQSSFSSVESASDPNLNSKNIATIEEKSVHTVTSGGISGMHEVAKTVTKSDVSKPKDQSAGEDISSLEKHSVGFGELGEHAARKKSLKRAHFEEDYDDVEVKERVKYQKRRMRTPSFTSCSSSGPVQIR